MYLDGKNVFGCLNMTAKTGGLAEHNTVWTEENARSGFTVKLRILDSRTAAIEVSMTNGRWQRVITGENTYDEDAKIYHFAADWFAPDTENIKYEQLLAPFTAIFITNLRGRLPLSLPTTLFRNTPFTTAARSTRLNATASARVLS